MRGVRSILLLVLATAGVFAQPALVLRETRYHLRAGEVVALPAPRETIEFVRNARRRTTSRSGFVVSPSGDGEQVLLGASLTLPPGEYAITISVTNAAGEVQAVALTITLDPVKSVPSSATKPPVVLLNGLQLPTLTQACPPSSTSPHSSNTFGSLESNLLSDGVPVVYFFDNCVEGPGAKIEDLGNGLGQFLNLIKYDTGGAVPQIDLVAHSMGGLIARAYLAGLQADGSLAPPASPRIRKLIQIATPNYGSFLATEFASLLGTAQANEMIPGSSFLWSLGTWNQYGDDLRGVDALAIIGNAGSYGNMNNASDGVVSLTSASLADASFGSYDLSDNHVIRTKVLPYCHTDIPPLFLAIVNCTAKGIANVDEAPETGQIVRSFLAGTSDFISIGAWRYQNPYLSQYGGIYMTQQNAAGQFVNDLTQVSFGAIPLQNGAATGTIFYNDFITGTGTFQETSKSLGSLYCGPFTIPAEFTILRCKTSPTITGVGPPVPFTYARMVQAGGGLTILGTGFGERCSSCRVTANPGSVSLQISSWSDQAITVTLPATFSGLTQIVVQTANGSDSVNILAVFHSISVNSATNAASGASGAIAPGEMITIKGTGLGPAAGAAFSVDPSTGMLDATLAGVQVLFTDSGSLTSTGMPSAFAAPLTYVSDTQINAIVPYEVAGLPQFTMQVLYQGAQSSGTTLRVANAAPGAFTFNSTGVGQAVAANQDGTFNGPASPAPKGSYLTIYFTGGGQTVPAGATGSVNSTTTLEQFQNLSATVGGQPVTVTFAGAAPGLVDGVCQLNIQLPANIATGDALPLVITADGVSSVSTATLAVQ